MIRWAGPEDQGWETHLRGTEWDRDAWREVMVGDEQFAVCPTCRALVEVDEWTEGNSLLEHRRHHPGPGGF